MLSPDQREAAALALCRAEADVVAIDPVTETWPGLDATDAYEIQLINARRRLAAGATIGGHKVGLSAKAMQDLLGVDEPDYGHLFADMLLPTGSHADVARYVRPRVEVEVAFVLGAHLAGPGVTEDEVLAATDHLVGSIEIVDSRIRDWRITLADTVADNASSAAVVLGTTTARCDGLDVADIDAVLWRNGEVVERGSSSAVLGNPATAVAWLANKVAEFGVKLEPGHVIMPGSCMGAVFVEAGDEIRAELAGLGDVEVTF